MADDHDALLAHADEYAKDWWQGGLVSDLAVAVRDLRADYLAALDVIARITTGWDAIPPRPPVRFGSTEIGPGKPHWYREPIVAEDGEDIGPDPMSDREWRVFCEAARRATRNTT